MKELEISGARLWEDRMRITLTVPNIGPVQQMEIRFDLKGADGKAVTGTLENTIHALGAASP